MGTPPRMRPARRAEDEEFFGLNGLDLKLSFYLDFIGGVFVEAGGNDGISQSNTLYFERYRGWHGLLIEPIPDLARQCRINRPHAIVEECALVAGGFQYPVVEMQYCNLMSLVRGARGSTAADDDHVAIGRQYLEANDAPYTVQVPARTLSSVLDAHGIGHIDLLSLDVEGYEGQVLQGIDYDRHAPRFILVEANHLSEIEDALGGRYQFVTLLSHHDRLYRLRDKKS
jgi:FkbM family methyltransferase